MKRILILLVCMAALFAMALPAAYADDNDMSTKAITGTGAAINVSIGWTPRKVVCYNLTDAGALYARMEWLTGMGNGKGFKFLKIADSGATGNLSMTYVASNGISTYAGSTSASPGYTIGADADLNVNGESIVCEAFR